MLIYVSLVLFLGTCQAVDIRIVGVEYQDSKYTGMIYKADTSSKDQSASKIMKVRTFYHNNKKNSDVIILMLWDEKTKYMPVDIFFTFPSVEQLHVARPNMKMESPINGHFLNAKKLQRIFITNQKFIKMGSNVFEGCTDIQWIYLEHNQIESVDEATFRGLRTLKKLSLQSNLIKNIRNGTFSKMPELEFLNLHNNLLTTLSSDVFATNKLLKTILIGVNRLLDVESLELAAESHDKIQMTDNLCTRSNYHNSLDVNKAVGKLCTIPKTPSEVVEEYSQNLLNPQMCDTSDKDKILWLKEEIKTAELEIKKLDEETLKLEDVLLAVDSLEVCFNSNHY